MAIYSCNLRSIGRSTHAAGTAGAHLRYIARPGETPTILAEHMPTDGNEARAWMDRQEAADRANARMCDKIRIALPRELSPQERIGAVRSFMENLTGGNAVPWFAAFHEANMDAYNPHVHVVVRDRSVENGKRVIGLSDSKRDWRKRGHDSESPTEHVRQLWEHHCNQALEQAGHEVRIDRRTLAARGIERKPTIHEGPNARQIENMVQRPESKTKTTGNGRVINYPAIDKGRTRSERNAEIIDLNLARQAQSKDRRTALYAQMEREQAAKDRNVSSWIAERARTRTQRKRDLLRYYRTQEQQHRQKTKAERDSLIKTTQVFADRQKQNLQDRQSVELAELEKRHGTIGARIASTLDVTGITRKRRATEKAQQQAEHAEQRKELVQSQRSEWRDKLEALSEKQQQAFEVSQKLRRDRIKTLDATHQGQIAEEDRQLQRRESQREQARIEVEADLSGKQPAREQTAEQKPRTQEPMSREEFKAMRQQQSDDLLEKHIHQPDRDRQQDRGIERSGPSMGR